MVWFRVVLGRFSKGSTYGNVQDSPFSFVKPMIPGNLVLDQITIIVKRALLLDKLSTFFGNCLTVLLTLVDLQLNFGCVYTVCKNNTVLIFQIDAKSSPSNWPKSGPQRLKLIA